MPSRKDIADTINEGMDVAGGSDSKLAIVFHVAQLQVQLDIRDLLVEINAKLTANAILKKHGTKKAKTGSRSR